MKTPSSGIRNGYRQVVYILHWPRRDKGRNLIRSGLANAWLHRVGLPQFLAVATDEDLETALAGV